MKKQVLNTLKPHYSTKFKKYVGMGIELSFAFFIICHPSIPLHFVEMILLLAWVHTYLNAQVLNLVEFGYLLTLGAH